LSMNRPVGWSYFRPLGSVISVEDMGMEFDPIDGGSDCSIFNIVSKASRMEAEQTEVRSIET
jgi:hypothetical protein